MIMPCVTPINLKILYCYFCYYYIIILIVYTLRRTKSQCGIVRYYALSGPTGPAGVQLSSPDFPQNTRYDGVCHHLVFVNHAVIHSNSHCFGLSCRRVSPTSSQSTQGSLQWGRCTTYATCTATCTKYCNLYRTFAHGGR